MRIPEILTSGSPVFSFEVYPPRQREAAESLVRELRALAAHQPSFVSVTSGRNQPNYRSSFVLAARVKRELGIEAMPHLTCTGKTTDEIRRIINHALELGLENILVVRGDQPEKYVVPTDGFRYAADLIHFIRGLNTPLAIGAACYPEGHRDISSLNEDLAHLKHKVDAGVNFLVSQLFYSTALFLAFRERARFAGINVPILPGILPITSREQLERSKEWGRVTVPERLTNMLAQSSRAADIKSAGLEYAAEQCRKLQEHDAPGINIFTMNQWDAVHELCARLAA